MEQISNSEIGQNVHRNISNVTEGLGEQSMSHLQNARAQCGKAQKNKCKKNAEIKSENHAHHFLRFGFSISSSFHKTVNGDYWALRNVCWQELVGFVLPERKAAGRFCVTMFRLTSASLCVNFSLPNSSL